MDFFVSFFFLYIEHKPLGAVAARSVVVKQITSSLYVMGFYILLLEELSRLIIEFLHLMNIGR